MVPKRSFPLYVAHLHQTIVSLPLMCITRPTWQVSLFLFSFVVSSDSFLLCHPPQLLGTALRQKVPSVFLSMDHKFRTAPGPWCPELCCVISPSLLSLEWQIFKIIKPLSCWYYYRKILMKYLVITSLFFLPIFSKTHVLLHGNG